MDTYTVLLVDDEEEVLQAIRRKINWEGLGFSVIGFANNGVKALEMVEEFQPDVVVTDIKMPYMDGMELSGHIKDEFPATKILIFTGFDEFEYAKEAVHLEVEEYILKPVSSGELTQVFTKLKEKLDQEISEKRSVKILQDYYMESLPLLQANFYASLMEGKVAEVDLPKYLSDYQIALTGPFLCCLVIHTSASRIPEHMTPLLLATSVQKQAEEYLGERWKAKCFSYLGNTVLIAQLNHENEISELTDECDRFCRYVRRMIGAVVTVGIGMVCREILSLVHSYASARKAVSYRAIYGASRAINLQEIVPVQKNTAKSDGGAEQAKLFKRILLGTEEEVTEAAEQYLEQLALANNSLQLHHIAVMELATAMYRFSVNNKISPEDIFGDMKKLYSRLLEMEPTGLKNWVVNISLAFHRKLILERSSSVTTFVLRAEEYVRSHYRDENLSLDTVCQALGVSNSYFSSTFKKETGKSFIGYLTDYRLEQAAKLLVGTGEKSYVIAKTVGYEDPNYFSYVFKRKFGVAPSKYRTEHEGYET